MGKQGSLQHTYNQYKQLQHYYKQIQIITIIYTAMTKHVINIGEFYNLEKWGAYLGGVSPSPLSPPLHKDSHSVMRYYKEIQMVTHTLQLNGYLIIKEGLIIQGI